MPSAEPSAQPSAGDEREPDYRFTLANERTFLAYERTAVGLAAASLAVFHLLDADWPERLLSAVLLSTGVLAALGGYLRWRAVERAIRTGRPLPVNWLVQGLAAAIGVCLVAVLLTVLV